MAEGSYLLDSSSTRQRIFEGRTAPVVIDGEVVAPIWKVELEKREKSRGAHQPNLVGVRLVSLFGSHRWV